ncbi:MAG: tetratricopeptide repeat protein, partial [Rhizobiales bacterium]|nr:tetratricopeptide repeat protein [Hyphomicrobiales bacterium]
FGKWLTLIALAGLGYYIWSSELITVADIETAASRIDLDRMIAAIGIDASVAPESSEEDAPAQRQPSDEQPPIETVASNQSAANQSNAALKAKAARAPTAIGPVLPQSGQNTVIAKNSRKAEPATSAFTGASDVQPGALPEPFGGTTDNLDQQSVLAPSGSFSGAQEVTGAGDTSAQDANAEGAGAGQTEIGANPFETFNGGGTSIVAPSGTAPATESGPAPVAPVESPAPSTSRGLTPAGSVDGDSRIAQARQQFVNGDVAAAIILMRDVLDENPGDVQALMFYGDVLMHDRKLAKAIEAYDKVLLVEPRNLQALVNRGSALLGTGRPGAAVEAAQAALQVSDKSVPATSLLSKAQSAVGEMREAMTACERIGVLTNSKAQIDWCRAAAQNQAGNTFVAVRMFISALNTGEQSFVREKQIAMRGRGLYSGAVDGASNQDLIDAVTKCAVAEDCIL